MLPAVKGTEVVVPEPDSAAPVCTNAGGAVDGTAFSVAV